MRPHLRALGGRLLQRQNRSSQTNVARTACSASRHLRPSARTNISGQRCWSARLQASRCLQHPVEAALPAGPVTSRPSHKPAHVCSALTPSQQADGRAHAHQCPKPRRWRMATPTSVALATGSPQRRHTAHTRSPSQPRRLAARSCPKPQVVGSKVRPRAAGLGLPLTAKDFCHWRCRISCSNTASCLTPRRTIAWTREGRHV